MPESANDQAIFRVDDLELDVRTRGLTRRGEPIALPKLSFDLFLALVRSAPAVVSIDELIQVVWGDVVVSNETVTQRVKLLRDALDRNGDKQHYIETVRGVGYRLRPVVTSIDAVDAASDPPDNPARDDFFRWAIVSAVAIVGLAVTASLYKGEGTGDSLATGAVGKASLAVLPFVAMSEAEDDGYFADGVTEEILNSLAQVPDLLVTARTSAFHFKGKDLPIDEIGAALNVIYVLEGSIRRYDDRLRITARLMRAADGFRLWSDTFEHTAADRFAVQMDIAENVAESLEVVLDDGLRQKMLASGVGDPGAFIAYQKGVELFEHAHGASPGLGALVEANRFFAQAIEIAPGFADAYLRHSDYFSHVLLSLGAGVEIDGYTSNDVPDISAQFLADYDSAIRHAPDERLKNLLALDRAVFVGAWHDLDRRIATVLAHPVCASFSWLETVALPFGYAEESRSLAERWLECDPLNFGAHMLRIRMLTALGEFAEMLRAAESSAVVIDHPTLHLVPVLALIGLERIEDAEAIVASRPDDEILQVGGGFWLAAARGDAGAARGRLARAHEVFEFSPGDLMAYHAMAGDRDAVNRIAALADERPFGHMVLVNALMSCYCGSVFDLEVTPRFAAMIEDAGLAWPPVTAVQWPLKTW